MRYYGMILITGAALLSACSSQPTENAGFVPPAIPVITEEVKVVDVPIYFESIGTLKAALKVDIRPQVSGMLNLLHFTEGQPVDKGDLLFSIDSQPYEIRLQEAEAQLAQNKAALEIARKKLDRYSSLSKKDLISKQEWDELQSQVAMNEAHVQSGEARVESAKLDLQHCSITSPVSGRTGKIAVHPGNLVSPSEALPLVTLFNIDNLDVEFTLTENEFQQLTPDHFQGNAPIEICTFCNQEELTKGTLTFLDSTFDAQTGLLTMKGQISNDPFKFLPGQHVRVRLPIQVVHDAMVVPQKAVKINQQGPYVYKVKEDETAEMLQVKLGDEVADQVVVLDGVKVGDKVVTEGHLRLAPGLKVKMEEKK